MNNAMTPAELNALKYFGCATPFGSPAPSAETEATLRARGLLRGMDLSEAGKAALSQSEQIVVLVCGYDQLGWLQQTSRTIKAFRAQRVDGNNFKLDGMDGTFDAHEQAGNLWHNGGSVKDVEAWGARSAGATEAAYNW